MKTITLVCENCKILFEKPKKEYTRWIKKGRSRFYCCQSCATTNTLTKKENVIRYCLWCKKSFISDNLKSHRQCCSLSCARRYSQKFVDRKKLSKTMEFLYQTGKIKHAIVPLENRSCCVCGTTFQVKPHNTRKTCSSDCHSKHLSNLTHKRFLDRVKNGTWTSWRKNTEPSYPEKFFMKVLENNSISYEYEFPFGRYSIDFALLNKKIAFEVDGQQHRFPDRQVSDKKKDELLVSSGWKVFRTKWKGNRYQKRREYIKSEIDRFLAFYNSTPDVLPI